MEREIAEQPATLAANGSRYLEELIPMVAGRPYEMVVLVARGSSDHAALYARYLLEVFTGLPVSLAAPSVVTRYGSRVRYPHCLGVGISQSGAAPDVSEVLEALASDGHDTIAITNTESSRLGGVAKRSLLLGVGEECSLPATKTYSASLLAAYQLARALGANLPGDPSLPDDVWLDVCREDASAAAEIVCDHEPLFALGRGFSFASAMEQALKLMECALVPCIGYSGADFAHGPRALAQPGSAVLLFGGVILDADCAKIACPQPPEHVAEPLRPIWEAFFLQCLALEVARRKVVDPDCPPDLQKITRTL